MTSWCDRRMAAFDCETTGVDVEHARIVAVAVVLVGGGEPTETTGLLLDPGVEIPAEATAVHGVSTERARAEGIPAAIGVQLAVEAIAARPADSPVVAMNARFDLTILDREARRHGLAPLSERGELLVVDPLVVDKHLDRFRKGSRKLDALCDHYRVRLDAAHDASCDAFAAARLAWRLGMSGKVVRRVRRAEDAREIAVLQREWVQVRHDLPALHAAQAGWAAEQARGLAEYFARQGKPERVEEAWPVVPVRDRAAA